MGENFIILGRVSRSDDRQDVVGEIREVINIGHLSYSLASRSWVEMDDGIGFLVG